MNNPAAGRKTLWAWTVATFFGAGFGKPGPGTWGSVAAVLLWVAYAWLAQPAPQALLIALLAGIAAAIALGVPAATIAARESGRRLFDITKPFPARQFESLPEGWGIVFDDVAAGLYALGVAWLLHFLLYRWI